MPLNRNVTATQNTHILAIVNVGTFSAYFTLSISNYEIYIQERLSPLNVQNKKVYTQRRVIIEQSWG